MVGLFLLQYAKLRRFELYFVFFDEFCDAVNLGLNKSSWKVYGDEPIAKYRQVLDEAINLVAFNEAVRQ